MFLTDWLIDQDKVLAGYTPEMAKAAATELKLCKKQSR